MTWLLTLVLILPGQTVSLPVGLMIDRPTCDLAGGLMARAVSQAAPGSVVGFTCTPPKG